MPRRRAGLFHLIDAEADSEKVTGVGLIGFQEKS